MANGVSSESLESGLPVGLEQVDSKVAGADALHKVQSPSVDSGKADTSRVNGEAVPIDASSSVDPVTNGTSASEQVSVHGMTGLAVPSEPITNSAKVVEEPATTSGTAAEIDAAEPAPVTQQSADVDHADASIEHTMSVDAPTSDLRVEYAPVKNPAESEDVAATADIKNESLDGQSNSKTANAPQSPISPPQEREETMPDVKPDVVSAPTPPQSAAVSPRASQESSEQVTASVVGQDTSMADAVTSDGAATSKHERTDESVEPPTKRARTDDGSGASSPGVRFSDETSLERKMTPNRQKYCLGVLRTLKRSKDAAPFLQPVDPVKLKIPDYFKIVTDPQDLGTIESKLKKNEFESIDQFNDSVELVWSNCQKYNGAESPINMMALRLKESFERQIRNMPAPEVVDPKASPVNKKGKKTGRAAGTPVATRPRNMSGSAPPGGVPAIRRESIGVDGRPKREIHAPPPKSLPYQHATLKKGKNAKQLKFCGTVLKEMTHKKHEAFAFPFYSPVDVVALGLHDYHTIIKKPMDLGTMQQKLNAGEYETADDFEYDMRLMFRNCYKYNGQGTPVNAMGKRLEAVFQQKWAEKPIARPAGASDSEDESEPDSSSKQHVDMLKKQLKAMEDQIKSLSAGGGGSSKKSKKSKSRYDDDEGGMGPRDRDYDPSSSKKGRKRRDSDEEADESPMFPTFQQKTELSNKMMYMNDHQMPVVIQILKRTDPTFDPEDEEVELDVDKVHPKTIRLLWNWIISGIQPSFLRKKAAKGKKNRSVLSEAEQQRQIQQLEARLHSFEGGDAYVSRYGDEQNGDSSNDSDSSEEED